MPMSQFDFFNHLKIQLADPQVRIQAIEFSKKKINDHNTPRLFDEFPQLVDENIHRYFVDRFILILSHLNDNQSFNQFDLPESMQTEVMHFQMEIIRFGRLCLFNKTGLNKDIFHFLELSDFELDSREVLCAFVGAMNQELMCETKIIDLLKQNQQTCSAVFNFINHYSDWVKEVLDEAGIAYKPTHSIPKQKDTQKDVKKPILLGSLANLTTSMKIGLHLFSHSLKDSNNPDLKCTNKRPN